MLVSIPAAPGHHTNPEGNAVLEGTKRKQAMSFARLKKSAPATSTAAPAPAPAAAAAPSIPSLADRLCTGTTATTHIVLPATTGGLKIPSLAKNTLAMIAKEDDRCSFQDMFPTLVLKGGNAGGTMIPTKGT